MFTIGVSRVISHSDDTEQQAQQVTGNPRIGGERRGRRQQEAVRKAQGTSLSTAKAKSSTQRPQTLQRQRQNTIIALQMEPVKRGNTDRRHFKKRWGDQATLTVYSKIVFYVKNIHVSSELRTAYQPLHHEQHWVLQ